MAEKRINCNKDLNDRLSKVALKLKIKNARSISQEDIILRYILDGLKRDEKKLTNINI